MRAALVSNVQGSSVTLEAVSVDIHSRSTAALDDLGDLVGQKPSGNEGIEFIRSQQGLTGKGNFDEIDGLPARGHFNHPP